ncbi:MAG: hypothetical protein KDC66_20030 [Phaeodactylibacter sp.]|nr:hypothetical protein [Phaeodactylibacter sp.]MCB9274535.1 hypothetical protein [Lewinellaceae bacterium]
MIALLLITLALLVLAGILPLSIYLLRSMQGREPERPEALDEEMTRAKATNEPFEWWEAGRRNFNRGLALAGVGAGMLYYGVLHFVVNANCFSDSRFGWLSFGFQFAAYLVYMGVANLTYNIGLILENVRQPEKLEVFRLRLYSWLFWLAVAMPFAFVAYLLLS